MPPRISPYRGGTRGGANASRGGENRQGDPSAADVVIRAPVETVGVKRPGFGTAGRRFGIYVNAFEATVPDSPIFHYDVVVETGNPPARFNFELITLLQDQYSDIFAPKVAHDGRKNMFSPYELALGETHSRRFAVTRPQGGPLEHIRLTQVARINTEALGQYLNGQKPRDEPGVLASIMALNVVLRTAPNLQYPPNRRLFMMPQEQRPIGGGIVLWRSIFQAVRPTIGRLIVNMDVSTGAMYKEGPLLSLCLEFLEIGPNEPMRELRLSPNNGLQDRDRLRLQKFLRGLGVLVENRPRVIRGLSAAGANASMFTTHAGAQITVERYFLNRHTPLQFPTVICAQIGAGAMVPLEVCMVPAGQMLRGQVPDTKNVDVLEFATLSPQEKLDRIKQGFVHLSYTGSDYTQSFGMTINPTPIETKARVLAHPPLNCGSKVTVNNGAWNMVNQKFRKPATIDRWIVIIYETQSRFPDSTAADTVRRFLAACSNVGITVNHEDPLVKYHDGQQNVVEHLRGASREHLNRFNSAPSLFVVILPNGGSGIYAAVKHFGDVVMGVPTQCLQSSMCNRAKDKYWNNVMLKVNVKLGGVNLVLADTSTLNDPAAATIVMGAHVTHPGPGAVDLPSIAALVGSTDSLGAKYVATSRVQCGRQEIISDLKDMCKDILNKFIGYRQQIEKRADPKPARIIFYRDGVSDTQFESVKYEELPSIKAACSVLGISPKITFIVVGKRHHIQFTPKEDETVDESGNCPAGLVLDTDVVHPTDSDFYLLSHAGQLGTSRPKHYSVLYDENEFNADTIQAFSFALCHVYARASHSVSIPAPVYYADIVCARAKNHMDPQTLLSFSDTDTQASGDGDYLETFQQAYKPLHPSQQQRMYFC